MNHSARLCSVIRRRLPRGSSAPLELGKGPGTLTRGYGVRLDPRGDVSKGEGRSPSVSTQGKGRENTSTNYRNKMPLASRLDQEARLRTR